MVFRPGLFQPGVFQDAEGTPTGVLDAVESGADSASIAGSVVVSGVLAAAEAGADAASSTGTVTVTGVLAGTESGADSFAATGGSEGTIIIIPRDAAGGTAYLVEVDAYDPALGEVVTLRYSSDGFNTKPGDIVPNGHYAPRLKVPGDYERTLFGIGGTAGDIQVGAGVVELVNNDGGLDREGRDKISDLSFDGRAITIKSVDRIRPSYADAITLFKGTLAQAPEFTWQRVRFVIRDRLAALDRPIQEILYAGTTISGGMDEAEGRPDDLKSQPKPLTFGAPRQVQAIASNIYDGIYDVGENGLDAITEVRDGGVALTYSGNDYATPAELIAASVPGGQYSTCLAGGHLKPGSPVLDTLTVAPVKGATAADRTAAQLARRIMLRMGLVENVDFRADDIAALDALNSAEIGYWIGAEERTALKAISDILGSIGATCVPDRLGVFRLYRLDAPAGIPQITYRGTDILEVGRRGIERLPTGDQGKGIPAWRVTVNYGWNGAIQNRSNLDVATSEEYKTFTAEEWRKVTAEDEAVKAAHSFSPELTFSTYFVQQSDAQAEAARRLDLYKVPRDRFRVPVKAFLAEQVDLNTVVAVQNDRFGLAAGKSFRTIGMAENFQAGVTTLDIWG